jgi:hypothetical protein
MELQISNSVATQLFNEDIGLSPGVNLFEGRMPADVINCVVVIMTGGEQPDRYVTARRSSTFQIMIRNTDYDAGLQKLTQVRNAFHGLSEQRISSIHFQWCYAISEGGALGQDEAGNELFSINFQCRIRSV